MGARSQAESLRHCAFFFCFPARRVKLLQTTLAMPKTVLIIDDDPQFRRLTGEILQTHGWRVLESAEGEAGVEDVRKHRPDVVLCDLLMPRRNGFQICRGIPHAGTLRHT